MLARFLAESIFVCSASLGMRNEYRGEFQRRAAYFAEIENWMKEGENALRCDKTSCHLFAVPKLDC